MDHHEDFDVFVDLVDIHGDALHSEVVFQLIDDHPGLLPLLTHARHHRVGRHAENG